MAKYKADILFVDYPFGPLFLDAWKSFSQHRKDIGKPFKTKLQEQKALSIFNGKTEEEAIAALNYTIANNWQGIWFPNKNNGYGTTKTEQSGNDRINAISNW